jgi:hypothetical protein
LFDRGLFLRPDHDTVGAPRAAAVKAGHRPPPEAARSGLDGGEHGAMLDGRDDGSRNRRRGVILDWAVSENCGKYRITLYPVGHDSPVP